jgi:hypothetical protein
MKHREWPAGHRLFTEGGFHLCFDPPNGKRMPAIVLTVDEKTETVTVLAVSIFNNDEAALDWFEQQRKKFAN